MTEAPPISTVRPVVRFRTASLAGILPGGAIETPYMNGRYVFPRPSVTSSPTRRPSTLPNAPPPPRLRPSVTAVVTPPRPFTRCLTCRSEVRPPNAAFCPSCGASPLVRPPSVVPLTVKAPPAVTTRCLNCNTSVPSNVAFCHGCGAHPSVKVTPNTVRCMHCSTAYPVGAACPHCVPAMAKCLNCAAIYPAGSLFCSGCGTNPNAAAAPVQEMVRCVNCDFSVPMGSLFCNGCGAHPTRARVKQMMRCMHCATAFPVGATCPSCTPVMTKCLNCATHNLTGSLFCSGCGTNSSLRKNDTPRSVTPPVSSAVPPPRCLNCASAVLNPRSLLCSGCGANPFVKAPSPPLQRFVTTPPLRTAPPPARRISCTNCATVGPEGALFCSACGVNPSLRRTQKCAICALTSPVGASFCQGCGARPGERSPPSSVNLSFYMTGDHQAVRGPPPPLSCRRCGNTARDPSAVFCDGCGQPF